MIRMQKKKKQKNKFSEYAKYTNIAFKMSAIILAGVFGGREIDRLWTSLEFPLATLVLSLLSVSLAIYVIIKSLI